MGRTDILWAGAISDSSGGGTPAFMLGKPDAQGYILRPGSSATLLNFARYSHENLPDLFRPVIAGDAVTPCLLATADVIAFELTGSAPAPSGGWESCNWLFSDGTNKVLVTWDGSTTTGDPGGPPVSRHDPRIVANGSISGASYSSFFKITPATDSVISFLLFRLRDELDTASPSFTITVTGTSAAPEPDAIGLISHASALPHDLMISRKSGYCERLSVKTLAEPANPPGLSAIAYRVGTYSQFKRSMMESLSMAQLEALEALKTRDDDDFSIALLDAWAVVADILTFYQERIANESYLRTTTERHSVLELARLIGYELRPGLAADVYLSFTIESAPGSPHRTTIDAGTRVQSVPGPDQKPQTFETVTPIEARADWNAMRPRLSKRHPFKEACGNLLSTFYFTGVATNLRPGEVLVYVPDDGKIFFCKVVKVTPQPSQQYTQVDIHVACSPLLTTRDMNLSSLLNAPATVPLSQATELLYSWPMRSNDLAASTARNGVMVSSKFDNFIAHRQPSARVLAFRTSAGIFGHNAPKLENLPDNLTGFELVYEPAPGSNPPYNVKVKPGSYNDRINEPNKWAETTLKNYNIYPNSSNIYLDTTYSRIVPGSYVVLHDGNKNTWGLHQVNANEDESVADFTLTGKVTRLTLDNNKDFGSFCIRSTTVYGQSEELTLARLPITAPVGKGLTIDVEGLIDGLHVGQGLMVCGELSGNRGNNDCEYVTIQDFYHDRDEDFTCITLTGNGLQKAYVRDTVSICGNIAPATHGETRQEVLGSGDSSRPYQNFTLSQSPLTYTSSAAPGEKFAGARSTLQVYVNDIPWHEVSTLYGHEPTEHIYTTRSSDDGTITLQFGDGLTNGARLPTGQENVRATYRTGSGLDGMVKAGQLTLLLTRPAGVRGVTNAQDAYGAAEPEQLENARRNVPLSVMTLGRLVLLRDYENFAAFAGVAKSLATWTWTGRQRGVFLTVAGPNGGKIAPDSPLYTSLVQTMLQAGDPYVSLHVQSYTERFFCISAEIRINPDYHGDNVAKVVEVALRANFSFEARAFGQPVALIEVTGVMQSVEGVLAVNVTALDYCNHHPRLIRQINEVLTASLPFVDEQGNLQAAELLTLDPDPCALDITIIK